MKEIKGYENKYAVDKDGNVYSLNYKRTGKTKKLKLKNNKGYLQVGLYKNGKQKKFQVHRLVAMTFLKDYSEDLDVDHIDRCKTNNKVSNLRMLTRQQNTFNTAAKGYTYHKGAKKWQASITVNRKCIYLGSFKTEQEAHQAYLKAKETYHLI